MSYAVTLCLCEKTGVLENAMYMPIEQSVQHAPATIERTSPVISSSIAILIETSDDAHAASTTLRHSRRKLWWACAPNRLRKYDLSIIPPQSTVFAACSDR